MTQQQSFESNGPYTRMNRFEKLEFIEDTTAFTREVVLSELIGWMNEDQFNQFYEHFCSNYEICPGYQELEAAMNPINAS